MSPTRRSAQRGAPTTAQSPTSTTRSVRCWTALSETRLAADTIVVLADHGDMLGERGLWYKMSFFEPACRIPLLIHAPRLFAPRAVTQSVSLIDLLPTLVELAGDGTPRRRHAIWTVAACCRTCRGAAATTRSWANTWPRVPSRPS